MLPAVAALRFRVFPESMAGSSAAVRLADGPGNKIQQRSIDDQTVKSKKNARHKKSDPHLSQYAPMAHLRAAEAYSDSFRD